MYYSGRGAPAIEIEREDRGGKGRGMVNMPIIATFTLIATEWLNKLCLTGQRVPDVRKGSHVPSRRDGNRRLFESFRSLVKPGRKVALRKGRLLAPLGSEDIQGTNVLITYDDTQLHGRNMQYFKAAEPRTQSSTLYVLGLGRK